MDVKVKLMTMVVWKGAVATLALFEEFGRL
jgi:hypothetical protein